MERYWITDEDRYEGVKGWVGVVDEVQGGIIAYFGDEAQARGFIDSISEGETVADA